MVEEDGQLVGADFDVFSAAFFQFIELAERGPGHDHFISAIFTALRSLALNSAAARTCCREGRSDIASR